ncbi:LOW QUALITY PROTEIN: multidrug resistance protein 1-like [Pomacea canaliculata]|uniref:LOW QUALITY PROTEIN: multidrug resistance protein 1-like n=1 Tax=Pomacea canaliculata TaxID=400727 RepID=UPI000D73C582|nr:LOW QUALITY PROTEIN: multidrug resistance protein 1-like [Pomacea canaliculata]
MMVVGMFGSVVAGCGLPLNMIVFGDVVDMFVDSSKIANATNRTYADVLMEKMSPNTMYFLVIAAVVFVTSTMAVSLWTIAGERQIVHIRKRFFRSIMRQDIGWFDTHEASELNSRFSADIQNISEGLCDKVAVFVQWMSTWLVSYIVAFVQGWKLTLVVIGFSPFVIFASSLMMRLVRSASIRELQAYAKSGAIAEQALRAIRTVQAFQGQEKEQKRYEDNLIFAVKAGSRKGIFLGIGMSTFWFIIFMAFAVSFWYGVHLIQTEGFSPGNILPVFFGVLIGAMSLGNALPNLENFSDARAAAAKVFEIIDLSPHIDVSSDKGEKIMSLKGVIEFKNIHFRYPARPDIPVLNGLDLRVDPGQTVALVGASGCGKSTTIQLLQRFYDPEKGQVTVDGHDIKTLNLKWLRDQIGVVSQEPVLFAATIAENIRYGKRDVTQAAIEAAAKEANAHGFISQLPEGYDTLVGERGAQLSGGQKQRIAIARALVRNPRILLLDEATSALDHESEAAVQSALEKAGQGRTTIVIAHRLSTIRNADKIVSISAGCKEEEGNHHSLIAKGGLYAQLINLQTTAEKETKTDVDDLDIVEDDDGDSLLEEDLVSHKVGLRRFSTVSGLSRTLSIRLSKRSIRRRSGEDEDKNKTMTEEESKQTLKRIILLSLPEWLSIVVGSLCSMVAGVAQPAFSLILTEYIRIFGYTDRDEQSHQAMVLGVSVICVGIGIGILRLAQNWCLSSSGSKLTARLRTMTFKALMRQDMSFFDDPKNQVSALTTKLSPDAALVQGATGSKVGQILEAAATIISALIIAFVFGWKLTLVVLAFLPIIIVAGIIQGKVIAGSSKSEKSQLQEAGKICSEAVDNIRTVASLNRADIFIERLESLVDVTKRTVVKAAMTYGVSYGISNSIIFCAYAAAFTYGTKLVGDGEMEFYAVFRVFSAIVFGGASVGRQSSFGFDYTKAKLAAGRLFTIIDRQPKIDIDKSGGLHLNKYSGKVAVANATFFYPTRPTVRVLGGLDLAVEGGQTLALVGGSGCGKSTVIQLLLRFYDSESGALLLDGEDTRNLDLRWLRQQIGLVSQEPVLMDGSIASNIAYGDNTREVSMAEIIAAAKNANIHSFIESLPKGYDTNVGDKGTQLSGGQKQRIAIARALVRNPRVLLLDEATSALDTESERVVQEALDKAREGRTCIVIAHRLSTIQNADKIAVIGEGRVVEIGTHSQLLATKGAYYNLLQLQGKGKAE